VSSSPAPDADPEETQEWLEALDGVVETHGHERADFLLRKVLKRARQLRIGLPGLIQTRYINTISPEQEPPFPGDEEMELRVRRIIRWNAALMVLRGNQRFPGLGGHLSTYASAASLFEVGFNHFFRGKDEGGSGDQVYFQGHAAPGIYARAFLEGRITQTQLDHFRREVVRGQGLSSYPHPRLMPDFWEFPTVSMGLGPMNSIYQARFNRYLTARGIKDTSASRVWAFLGDGEMDEPEAVGALSLAAREGLDNLTFVVNCNLQRLDGPVRGNGKIVQELEAIFTGAGWNVIKVLWSRDWDSLFAQDYEGALVDAMNETVDGEWQRYSIESGGYIREHFFGRDPRLLKMVEHLSDDQIRGLRRGGHDYRKVYAAYKVATATRGKPVAILAHTVKGWTLGPGAEARNMTHQMKKLNLDELRKFRDRLELPIPDRKLADAPYYHPGASSPEVQYLMERRTALGGCLPKRVVRSKPLARANDKAFAEFFTGTREDQAVSTTMAFAKLLRNLIRDPGLGRRVVPIIPDEARTFGLEVLFREIGIYASSGQNTNRWTQAGSPTPRSRTASCSRRASPRPARWRRSPPRGRATRCTARSRSRSTSTTRCSASSAPVTSPGRSATRAGAGSCSAPPPAAPRSTARACSTRTGTVTCCSRPCRAWSPTTPRSPTRWRSSSGTASSACTGTGRTSSTTSRSTIRTTRCPPCRPASRGILKGLYLYRGAVQQAKHRAQIFGSGPMMLSALRAQEILAQRFEVAADVWSVTSYQQLRNEALSTERWNRLHPGDPQRVPYITRALASTSGPVIATSDFMKAVPDMIGRWIGRPFVPLGTDGFGRSDTRDALRRHFEVDAEHWSPRCPHWPSRARCRAPWPAIEEFKIDPGKTDPPPPGPAARRCPSPAPGGTARVIDFWDRRHCGTQRPSSGFPAPSRAYRPSTGARLPINVRNPFRPPGGEPMSNPPHGPDADDTASRPARSRNENRPESSAAKRAPSVPLDDIPDIRHARRVRAAHHPNESLEPGTWTGGALPPGLSPNDRCAPRRTSPSRSIVRR
jgi:pyruvate dehydrogenase E1 component